MLVVGVGVALGGCVRFAEHASNEVEIDSLPVSRAAWLQLQNGSTADVRVYTVIQGRERYIGTVDATHLKRFVLDAERLRTTEFAITIRRSGDSTSKTFQPLHVRRGETIEVVVRSKLDRSALSVRGS